MVCSRNRTALRHGVTTVTNWVAAGWVTADGSRSHVAGIKAPGNADVGGALDDGSAVGENHQVVGVDGDAQGEFVGADRGELAQPARQAGQIERPVALVNLHRVAAAKAHRRAPGAVEMNEVAEAATDALRIPRRRGD